MQELKLTSPMPVSVNHYIKPRAFIVHGKPQISLYETAEAKEFKNEFIRYVKEQVKVQDFHPSTNKFQHYYVECNFYFPRTHMDANNHWKILLDAITESGAVWLDDSQVCERVNKILYDAKNPRIEMRIFPVTYVGIFPDQESADQFRQKCTGCNRYRNGRCSILLKAFECRVQEEITGLTCTKYKIKE